MLAQKSYISVQPSLHENRRFLCNDNKCSTSPWVSPHQDGPSSLRPITNPEQIRGRHASKMKTISEKKTICMCRYRYIMYALKISKCVLKCRAEKVAPKSMGTIRHGYHLAVAENWPPIRVPSWWWSVRWSVVGAGRTRA